MSTTTTTVVHPDGTEVSVTTTAEPAVATTTTPVAGKKSTLFHHPVSGNALGSILYIKEKKLPYELEFVDIMKGEQMADWFIALNPFHQIPTLATHAGTGLFESGAILRHLALEAGETITDKTNMALDWRQTVFYPIIAKIYAPVLGFGGDMATVPEGVEGMKKKVEPMLAFFLAGKPFIGGDSPCIADYSLAPCINMLTPSPYWTVASSTVVNYLAAFKAAVPSYATEGAMQDGYMASKKPEDMDWATHTGTDAAKPPAEAYTGDVKPSSTLYHHPVSGNALGSILYIQHNKLPYALEFMDIMAGKQNVDWYIALNPNHQIPTLAGADGVGVFESGAILRKLALEAGEVITDKTSMALDWRQTAFYKVVAKVYPFVLGFGGSEETCTEGCAEMIEKVEPAFEWFLGGKPFVGGDKPSIADYSIAPVLNMLTPSPYWPKASPAVQAYLAAFKAAVPEYASEPAMTQEGYLASKMP